MRIGYLTSQYPAISHTFIRREVEALRHCGFKVDTFSIRRAGLGGWMDTETVAAYETTSSVLPTNAVQLVGVHARSFLKRPVRYLRTLGQALQHRVPGTKAAFLALAYFAEAILLARELEQRRIEHLHNHFANAGANVGFLASRFLGLGWSLTLHGTADFDYPAGLLLQEKIEASRFVACVSHFGRAQAQRCVEPEQWPKLFVSRCGVEVRHLPERVAARDAQPLRVLSVGRLAAEKAFPGLLEAFSQVRARGVAAELDIVGDGPHRDRLQEQIQRLQLSDCCRLLGQKSEAEVLREMARADVFVMSSLMEGLPVVLMEAMALEVAVVAPWVAGIPELVQDGKAGLLYSPGNWSELGERLQLLLEDSELRQRLGREGRRRILEEFDIERAVQPLAERLRSQ